MWRLVKNDVQPTGCHLNENFFKNHKMRIRQVYPHEGAKIVKAIRNGNAKFEFENYRGLNISKQLEALEVQAEKEQR